MSQQTSKKDVKKQNFNIQIIASFKNKSKKFKNHESVVQGEPFSWGVTIKNIGSKPTPEGTITGAGIKDLNDKYFQYMEASEKFVRSLNPNEEIFIEIDEGVIYLEGVQWSYIDIKPNEEDKVFITHQFDKHHNKTTKFWVDDEDDNRWMDQVYIQKKMELLQSRTNQYILLLTIVTVWESIFGIKDTLKNFATLLSIIFTWIAAGVEWLGKLL